MFSKQQFGASRQHQVVIQSNTYQERSNRTQSSTKNIWRCFRLGVDVPPCYSTPITPHEASDTSTRVVRPHRGLQRTKLRRTSVTVTVGARKKIPLTPYTTMPTNKNRTWPSYAAMLAVLIITPRWPSSSASFSTILLVARVYACMRVGERDVLSTGNKMLCR